MYEVELKLRADHGPVRTALRDLGADHVDSVVQRDTYYDAPHRDFAATDEALRVREESPQSAGSDDHFQPDVTLTYKGPLVDDASKSRRESGVSVGSLDAIEAVLDGLGFTPVATVAKRRERHRIGDDRVVLDRVERLGEFVEVERPVDARDAATGDELPPAVAAARDDLRDRIRALGLDPDDADRTSYLEQLLDRTTDSAG